MSGSMRMSNGKNKTKGRLNKCRNEKEKKEGRSHAVATTAASGDIPPETAHHNEKGFKGQCYVCGVQGHSAKYCPKGGGKGKSKGKKERHNLGGIGEKEKEAQGR